MASYDRSGRMSYELLAVQPASGWVDPLKDYFNSLSGFFGGGLTTYKTLSDIPIVISMQLNEWVRFDAPGHYRVRLTTHRVAKIRRQGAGTSATEGQSLTSNELQLTIIPATKEWQVETLRQAVEAIDRATLAVPVPQSQTPESVQQAVTTLRYLDTADAAQAMAQRLKDDNNAHQYSFGLIGSPERETALKAMQEQLTNPDHPITQDFLFTLSVLSVQPNQSPDAMRNERMQVYERIRTQLWESISNKRGAARGISLVTALTSGADQKVPEGAIQQLAASFDDLPLQKQQELIGDRWALIKGPEFLPILRKYAHQYQDFPVLNESKAYDAIRLSGAALQHWYELAPEEARPAVIEEILRPKPRFDAKTLGMLPDGTLPDLERTLVDHLISSDNFQISGNLASLIERYATNAVLPQMLSIVDAHIGKWACAVQTPALAYLLRVDPASARPRLEAAMAARGQGFTACNHSLLTEVGKLHVDSILEEIADRSLRDDDVEVAGNAAAFLGHFGSSAAEQHLWQRFEEWSNQWRGRESELQFVFGEPNPNQGQSALGRNLAQSLATGQRWLANPARLQRIAQLSVDASMRQQAEHMIDAWRGAWSIHCFGPLGGASQFCGLLQYQDLSVEMLKEKLAQFPSGSQFTWMESVLPKPPDQEGIYRDLLKFVNDHGMTLRKPN